MRTARTLAAATLGTAAVSLGLVAAAPAAFAGVDKGPADQQVISEHGPFEISASESVSSLDVTGPQGQPAGPVERSAEGRPSLIFDTACLEAPQPECAGGPVAANGAWTIQVSGVGEERRTFFLRIGGFPVTEVVAELAERTATVTWKPGPEPDVTGWRVSDDQGAVQTVPKDVCDEEGETCSAVFAYPPSATGDRTFSVRAARSCGLEGCPDVLGAPAKSNVVTLPKAKAQPQPTDSGTPSPSGDTAAPSPSSTTAPGRTGSGRPGTGRADPGAFSRGFGSFSPKLGLPKLPPLPRSDAPLVAAPSVAEPEVADGTYDPSLGYEDRMELEAVPPQRRADGREGTTLTSTGGLLEDEGVLRGLAGALVLGLSGAHLRTWLARARAESLDI